MQLEKQQKKLEMKGIMVEISQLRLEWEAARNGGKGGNNEPIADHEIDVVGDDDSDSEEATPDVLMLKVSTSMSKTRPVCGRPQRRPQVVGRGWPEPEAARGVIWRRKKSPERQLHG